MGAEHRRRHDGAHARLIKNGALPTLVALLQSPNDDVLEQAVWVLGNIAGDGTAARDAVVGANAVPSLLRCFHEAQALLAAHRHVDTLQPV